MFLDIGPVHLRPRQTEHFTFSLESSRLAAGCQSLPANPLSSRIGEFRNYRNGCYSNDLKYLLVGYLGPTQRNFFSQIEKNKSRLGIPWIQNENS